MLSADQIHTFQRDGYLVLPGLAQTQFCESVIAFAQAELDAERGPIEYEADTRYPGAPSSRDAEGGRTARRLLQAYARSTTLAQWATKQELAAALHDLMQQPVYLSQAHHNCIMTKQARYSSLTGWHRDSRYWHFQRPELISVWLALRDERVENGCLLALPGSHRWQVDADQLDSAQFLRADVERNQALLEQARALPLQQGDVLLFSSNLFHAAGCNQTPHTKFSLVFTYRGEDNPALPGTRSASYPELALSV